MSKNDANQDDKSSADDEGTKVTEDDLRKDKEEFLGVDGSDKDNQDDPEDDDESTDDDEETGDDDGKTDDDSEEDDSDDDSQDDSDDDDSEFVKELPDIKGETLTEYARNLEDTVIKSNTEGKRLADELRKATDRIAVLESGASSSSDSDGKGDDKGKTDVLNPMETYFRQEMEKQGVEAITKLKEQYSEVDDPVEYGRFVAEVKTLGETIWSGQKRLASPEELYTKAAVILGWKPADKVGKGDKLKVAIKERGTTTKTSSSTKKAPKSKVTDEMIRVNRIMYPNKTDDEIRTELEPHVK